MDHPIVQTVCTYVLLFALYSVSGWMMEVLLKYIQYRRLINRGYLIGPYCPIYGWGALLITLLAGGAFFPRLSPGETFLVGFVACGALEYFVSWYLEKTSHARWWDYSHKPMNLNGRIWIGNLILFGLAAVGIVYLTNPLLLGLLSRLSPTALRIVAGAFLLILWSDRIVSHFLMRILRNSVECQQGDNTEEIRQEMHRMLQNRALLLRRISQAYPGLQPRPARMVARLKAARAEYRAVAKRLRGELNSAQRTLAQRGSRLSQSVTDATNARAAQLRALQKQARDKLRAIEDNLFNK